MNRKVLFVDDDAEILHSFRRQLHREYDLHMATSGEMGLDIASQDGPFAVVVADINMPLMDGIELLRRFAASYPTTARVILTGRADLQTAIEAVNQGNVFRFLTKPCQKETMVTVLEAGIRQYQLEMAEHELLEQTLNGSINLLVEILSLARPDVFQMSSRTKQYVQYLIRELELQNGWQFELAMMLSHIGAVAFPVEPIAEGRSVDEAQGYFYAEPPVEIFKTTQKLLENIPRFESIGAMIENCNIPYRLLNSQPKNPRDRNVFLGAQILRVCIDFDQRMMRGYNPIDAVGELANQEGVYNPMLLKVLENFTPPTRDWKRSRIGAKYLKSGAVLDQDVYSKDGTLLLRRGREVTFAVHKLLLNYHYQGNLVEPFFVLLPD